MTIINTKHNIQIKTELTIHDANNVTFSRIIDSKLYEISLNKNAAITMSNVANIIRLENEMFKILAKLK